MKNKYNIGEDVYVEDNRFSTRSKYPHIFKMKVESVYVTPKGSYVYNWVYFEDEVFRTPDELKDYLINVVNKRRDDEIKALNEEFNKYNKEVIQ